MSVKYQDVLNNCGECEYADDLGDKQSKTVDCHNPDSPRFTPEREFVCYLFYPNTIKYPKYHLEI